MKKKVVLFIVLSFFLLSLPILFIGCNEKSQVYFTKYKLNLTFIDENYTLEGQENVEYYNNSDNMFEFLCFHLYPNAYREDAKNKIVSVSNMQKAYPNGESYGNIDILEVKSGQETLNYEITGQDKNILKIMLKNELYPDERVELSIKFIVKLANINHRLGYGENTINCANFYPIACVYNNGKGFNEDLYHSNGDPFCSECSNYEVNINYPSEYFLASSGQVEKSENIGNLRKNTIKCEKIREFSFILSKLFKISSEKVGNTIVNYFGYKEDENLIDCLKVSVKALKTFNKLFGEYPYEVLNIAKSNFAYGGMEYPNLVLISDDIQIQKDYEYVIIHEIAHQWWYGVVGNDQYNHAWMDEGLAEFSTLLFFKENPDYGENFIDLLDGCEKNYKFFEKIYKKTTGEVDGRMDRPLHEFKTEPEYSQCTYTKGVLLFNSIMSTVGERKFYKALQNYYSEFAYMIAYPEDMIASFSSSTGYDLEGFIKSWLNGRVIIGEN